METTTPLEKLLTRPLRRPITRRALALAGRLRARMTDENASKDGHLSGAPTHVAAVANGLDIQDERVIAVLPPVGDAVAIDACELASAEIGEPAQADGEMHGPRSPSAPVNLLGCALTGCARAPNSVTALLACSLDALSVSREVGVAKLPREALATIPLDADALGASTHLSGLPSVSAGAVIDAASAHPNKNIGIKGGIGCDHALSQDSTDPSLALADGVDRGVRNTQVLSQIRHGFEPCGEGLPVGARIHE